MKIDQYVFEERQDERRQLANYLLTYCNGTTNQKKQRTIMYENLDLYFDLEGYGNKDFPRKAAMDIVDSKGFHDTKQRNIMTKDINALKQYMVIISNAGGVCIPTEEESYQLWLNNRIKVLKMLMLSNTQFKLQKLDKKLTYDFDAEEIELIRTLADPITLGLINNIYVCDVCGRITNKPTICDDCFNKDHNDKYSQTKLF